MTRHEHDKARYGVGEATSPARAAGHCGADELKSLLSQITDQILDADRRHTEVLRQMHERLALLGQEARSMRASAPEGLSSTFDRIEGSMAHLADRVAEAGGRSLEAAPMALRSAAQGHAMSHAAPRSDVDPFDVLDNARAPDSVPASDPWDSAAAEALTRLHESGETGYAVALPDPESAAHAPAAPESKTVVTGTIEAAGQIEAAQASPVTQPGSELDKTWLEDQIASLAHRLEQSIGDLGHDRSAEAIGQRFADFEERLASAFDGVASRADVEGLGLIEAHINELTQHVEESLAQLSRLEGIETQLHSVMDQLSDERLATIVPQLVPATGATAATSISDLETIAVTAAERTASRMQRLASEASEGLGANEIRAMLNQFMDERRVGDEQMASMLDTMQQALIRVLDRMDGLEMAQQRVAAAASAPVHAAARVEPQLAMPVHAAQPMMAAAPAVRVTELGVVHPSADMPRTTEGPFPGPAPQAVAQPRLSVVVPPATDPEPQAASSAAQPSIERLRQDFRADAQRAKLRAEAAAAAATAASDAQGAVKLESPTKAGARQNAPQATHVAEEPAPPSNSRKKILIGVLALMVALAGGMMLMPKRSAPEKPAAAKIERTNKPKPAASMPADVKTSAGTEADGSAASKTETSPAAKAAPGAATSDDPSDVPAPLPQKRTVPETMMEDLGGGGEVPEASIPGKPVVKASAETTARNPAMPLGMDLQSPGAAPIDPDLFGSSAAPVTKVALSAEQAAVAPTANTAKASALDLPPVTVGPLSLRLAAAKGDPSAEFEVGSRLAEGKGTQQNFQEAMRWYQRSATRGFAQAQYRLGTLYERGLGAPMDLSRARVWYTRAAEQGNVKAMHNLAVLAAGRETGTPDYDTAAHWFAAAAERNLADSQFNFGVLLESGLGVEKDLKQAYKWYSLSAKNGDREAVRRRDALRASLSDADRADAEREAAQFVPTRTVPIVNDARFAGEDWKKRQTTGDNG